MNAITLPYPPSTNRLTRFGNGRAYQSPAAKAWKQDAAWAAKVAGAKISALPMSVEILLHPRANKDGSASKSRIDIDNAIKATLDCLNGLAWYDDKQVVRVLATVAHPVPDGGLSVSWIEV